MKQTQRLLWLVFGGIALAAAGCNQGGAPTEQDLSPAPGSEEQTGEDRVADGADGTEPALPKAPVADDQDDAFAEPVANVPARSKLPRSLAVMKTDVDFEREALNIQFDTGDAPPQDDAPRVNRLLVRVVGAGHDETTSLSPDRPGSVTLRGADGSPLPDGLYKYEVSAQRELISGAPVGAVGAQFDPLGRRVDPQVAARSALPRLPRKTGTFTIQDGELVQPAVEPPPTEDPRTP